MACRMCFYPHAPVSILSGASRDSLTKLSQNSMCEHGSAIHPKRRIIYIMLNTICVMMQEPASDSRHEWTDRIYTSLATECCEFLHIWKRTRLTHAILSWFRGVSRMFIPFCRSPSTGFWLPVIHFSTYPQDSVAPRYVPETVYGQHTHIFLSPTEHSHYPVGAGGPSSPATTRFRGLDGAREACLHVGLKRNKTLSVPRQLIPSATGNGNRCCDELSIAH